MLATRAEVTEAVHRLLAEQLTFLPKGINDNTDLFDELGMDSLDAVELLIKSDHCFDLDITDEECEGVNTVGELVTMLMRHEINADTARAAAADAIMALN